MVGVKRLEREKQIMKPAAFLKGLLSFVTAVATYFNNKKLIDGATAKVVLEGLEHANKAITDTKRAQSDDGVRESVRKKYTKR